MSTLISDIRYALRAFRKQPVFTMVAVLTLTLGIGANTAIFSLLYQVLLRPLPYAEADRLVFVWNSYPLMGLQQASVSIPDYIDRKTQAPAIEDTALFTGRAANAREAPSDAVSAAGPRVLHPRAVAHPGNASHGQSGHSTASGPPSQ